MSYSSDFFPSLEKTREFWADTKSITAKKLADSFRYLNQQYKKMVDSTKKGSVTNYKVYKENIMKADIFNARLEKKYGAGAGFIENIDRKTGLVTFKTGQYGKYTQEERRELMAIRDYVLGNWSMSPGKFELYKQELAEKAQNTFVSKHPTINAEAYENFTALWDLPIWNKIRVKGKYQVAIEQVIHNAKSIIDFSDDGFEKLNQILNGAASVDDFNRQMEDYIASLI